MRYRLIFIGGIVSLMICYTKHVNAQAISYDNSINKYSLDLYNKTKQKSKNLLLSPISTYYILLMMSKGAKGKTEQELERVLYLDETFFLKRDLYNQFSSKSDNDYGLQISNCVWVDNNLKIKKRYKNIVSGQYLTDLQKIDFTNKSSVIDEINNWSNEKTKGKITKITEPEDLSSDTKLLISNVVYFKEEWRNKFNKERTASAPFFSDSNTQYMIDFMRNTETLLYFENDEFQFISKPYESNNFSFCVLLPKELFGIEEVENDLNNIFLHDILNNSRLMKTSLYLPKIKIESSNKLKNVLENTGLKTAFTEHADFSGITTDKDLRIEELLHKTVIELDEEKTEAAAASAIAIRITGTPSFKIFKADHPFIFFILDNQSKNIVFIGRYVEPVNGEKIEEQKTGTNLEKRKQENFSSGPPEQKILILLNNTIITQSEMSLINPNDVASVNVYNDKETISKYSKEEYDGMILITTKNKK